MIKFKHVNPTVERTVHDLFTKKSLAPATYDILEEMFGGNYSRNELENLSSIKILELMRDEDLTIELLKNDLPDATKNRTIQLNKLGTMDQMMTICVPIDVADQYQRILGLDADSGLMKFENDEFNLMIQKLFPRYELLDNDGNILRQLLLHQRNGKEAKRKMF